MGLKGETEANFIKFRDAVVAQAERNYTALKDENAYLTSYRKIAAINSIKVDVLSGTMSEGALAFFHEAHNDLLLSHVNASVGSWRNALKCLRSCIENAFACFYFKDHHIELKNWERGRYKTWFADLRKYYEVHPDLSGIGLAGDLLGKAKDEYSQLSLAVHGSSKAFRMTDDVSKILLWSDDAAKLGKWLKRESEVLNCVALLCVLFNRATLQGSAHAGTREALGFIFGPGQRTKIKKQLGISIGEPG